MDVGHDLLWDTYDSPWPYSGTYNSATGSSSYTYNFVHHVSFSDLYYNNDGNYFNLTGSCKNKYVYNGSTHSYSGSSFTTGGPIEGRLRGYNFTGDATINGSY